MANKKVTLVRVCKTDEGWKRLPIVMGKNGKIRPGYALVDNTPTLLTEGYYALRRYEGKRTVYETIGDDAADALAAQQRKSHLLLAKDSAASAGVKIVEDTSGRVLLSKKRDEFIKRHLAKGQVRASETSTIAINDFLDATAHTYADQITEASVLDLYRYLRKRGNQDRTIYNKHVSLFGWFKWLGLDLKKLAEKPPSYTEREVVEFHAAELKTLFKHCNEYPHIVFETLLKTGMRMQEAMHLEWPNIDFKHKVIKVREHLDDDAGVKIKDRAERSVPLADDLAVSLKKWHTKRPKSRLVLGTANDTPNWKWLPMLKRVARDAGLNCGRCSGCRGTEECAKWKLKTFRSTYTTKMLRDGVDPRTLMSWTGHEDLATILKYLAPSKDPNLQKKVSRVKWF